ncbi:LuxR family transcriptional regulator [Antiquaquibacter soli]|uniref:LuxR C-terminal-related transcriptional regulator n=1 Tax=Antiquaquibacter soli TaxID=3064523 RepID=A0ABT9BQL4_9MICO|nr:LuxR family transcriptional regulator [Protaetiibacter sp. WY-16]MDO7883323.1 LuxR C-terminal-related transcriptional regulator [Protaetiibacter sp. WY-16]
MERVGPAQLRALLDEVALLAPVTTLAGLRGQVPDQLMRLVRSERAGWVTMNRLTGVMSGNHVPEMLPHLIPLMPRDLGDVPMVAELVAAATAGSLRISDVVPADEWKRSRLRREIYEPLGGQFQIGSLIASDEGLLETVAVFRNDSDFSDAELETIEAFARHVRLVAARIRRAEGRAAEHSLTARQRQVLAALEGGATVRRAAWELGVSEKTVENHLQAIYRRLGVTSRAAALLAVRS